MKKEKKGVRRVNHKVEKKNKKHILLVVLILLVVVNLGFTALLAINYYKSIGVLESYEKTTDSHEYMLQQMNTISIVNDGYWADILAEKTGLVFEIPDGWYTLSSQATYCSDVVTRCDNQNYEILLFIGDGITYDEFAEKLYASVKDADEDGVVQSFREDTGYYDILSFEESANGIMYFDEKFDLKGQQEQHKIKVEYDSINSQVYIQIDIY